MYSDLVGKRILVDIREFDEHLTLRCSRNFAGVIVAAAEAGLEIRRDDTLAVEELFVDEDDLEHAEPGEYWLRTTGERIVQPDFLAEWTHYDRLDGYTRVEIRDE